MSVKVRLYPTPDQAAGLMEHCHQARFIYNLGLEQRSMWRRDKHTRGEHPEHGDLNTARITTASQMRELTALRASLDWVAKGSVMVQQQALRDLDRAFTNFYAGRGKYPQFKRRSDREGSFNITELKLRRINRKWATVTVPKVGLVRFRLHRAWGDVAAARSARITLRNGRWHVSLTTPPAAKIAPAGEVTAGGPRELGIDRGVANTVALSDGRMLQAPAFTPAEERRFLLLQRRVARQQKDSRRRQVTLDKLAVLRRRLADRRTNWIEQTTTELARGYALIAVEDLKVTNMVRRPAPRPDPDREGTFLPNGARPKAALNRAILASLWGKFLTRLEQKTQDGVVIRVDPKNTSRTCVACGHCAPENRKSQAVFECEACGHTAHADTNAAIIILNRGIAACENSAARSAVNGRISPPTMGGCANHPAT